MSNKIETKVELTAAEKREIKKQLKRIYGKRAFEIVAMLEPRPGRLIVWHSRQDWCEVMRELCALHGVEFKPEEHADGCIYLKRQP